jgi:Cu2+-exporting ATPase
MITSAAREHSRIAGIAALADRAAAERSPAAALADTIARVFVPGVLLLAALSGGVWLVIDPTRSVNAVLSVLVVSCPCALSLATPATFTAAMTRLRQAGIVLTRSSVLETVPTLDRAILDKTGTLTVHEPTLLKVEAIDPAWIDQDTALDIAAALEQYATHPIARAFPRPKKSRVENVTVHAGEGVAGVWKGHAVRLGAPAFCGMSGDSSVPTVDGDGNQPPVVLCVNGRVAAHFTIDDPPRPDAAKALVALRAHGILPLMASGDSAARCEPLASALGIAFVAAQSPENKLALVNALKSEGHRVLMLGDGINDIPALAAADVSATVLESSDLVRSRSDVLLLNRRLDCLPLLFETARRAQRVLRQNLAWSLLYNVACIPLAALGLLSPALAALGMTASSSLVLLNASRLLSSDQPRGGAESS